MHHSQPETPPEPQTDIPTTSLLTHHHFAQCAQQQTGCAFGSPYTPSPGVLLPPSTPLRTKSTQRTSCPMPGRRPQEQPTPLGFSLSMVSATRKESMRQHKPWLAQTSL